MAGATRVRLALAAEVAASRLLGRHRPLSLGWQVTTACNATCEYCAYRKAAPNELTTKEALRLIDQMAECGTRVVSLSGGEPLARKDFPELVAALVARAIGISLNTNGFLVPRHEALVRQMRRVSISLDGPPEVHDAVRGAGTHARALRAIERCQEWRVPVTISTVLTSSSLPHLDAHLAWCRARGLKLQVQPADPYVLGSDLPDPHAPDPAELKPALERLLREPLDTLLNTPAGLRHLMRYPEPTPMRCASGRITARISSTGIVKLCGRQPRHAPEVSWREHGLAEAFARLHPVACDRCWCAPRVDVNLGYQGKGLASLAVGRMRGLLAREAGDGGGA